MAVTMQVVFLHLVDDRKRDELLVALEKLDSVEGELQALLPSQPGLYRLDGVAREQEDQIRLFALEAARLRKDVGLLLRTPAMWTANNLLGALAEKRQLEEGQPDS